MSARILSVPFELGRHQGRVNISYSTNRRVSDAGFEALGEGFTNTMVQGFPVMKATVSFSGRGYGALFGWIQIVSHEFSDGVERHIEVDLPRSMEGSGFPYCAVGYKPSMIDAPCNRPATRMTWRAYTFLFPFITQPERKGRRLFLPIEGFTWGYKLSERGMKVEMLELRKVGQTEWLRLFPRCLRRFPKWFEMAKRDSVAGAGGSTP